MVTVREISTMLKDRTESVAKMLLPNGRISGLEYEAGSTSGEKGKSLKVRLGGEKRGIWCDFETGEKGDLLDLWRITSGMSMSETIQAAKEYLGITDPTFTGRRKTYSRPQKTPTTEISNASVEKYLTQERGLQPEFLKLYLVGSADTIGPFPTWRKQEPMAGPWITFPSYRDGGLLGVKYLRLGRKDGKKITFVEAGCEPTLFGWHAIPETARVVTITEGELDAITLAQYGFPALSVPMGGGGGDKQKWVDTDWVAMERFELIYLCLDMDDAGREAAQELIRRLGPHRCLIVSLPYKDANECLQRQVAPDVIRQCFDDAKSLEPEELRQATSFTADVIDEFYPSGGKLPGWDMPLDGVNFRFLRGEVSVYTGISGHGKSTFLGQIMLGAMSQGEKVCIASLEMSPRKTLHRMVRQAFGLDRPHHRDIDACMEWFADRLWLFNVLGTGKFQRLMDVFLYAYRRHGVRQFVLDSLMKVDIAEDDYNGQKRVMDALCDFVMETGAHIHIVVHPRKGSDELTPAGKMDVKGSGAIINETFNLFSIFRHKAKERMICTFEADGKLPQGMTEREVRDQFDAILFIDKSRNVEGVEGAYRLWLDYPSMQYRRRPDGEPVQLVHGLETAPF